ncbi:MAG: hypothetical protein BWY21_00754 [Parcubacteria group bacterium ADurb.Bin216]|jgi:hypothetical protein|nr:MAG: hypothetical protein BWY21_00754 [Parcubacteria group bacterium ADurb.Bin216]
MTKIKSLSSLIEQMLNLSHPWVISDLELDTDNQILRIKIITIKGEKMPCPVCGMICHEEGCSNERTFRYLDFMQFKTYISCVSPRISCPEHGVLDVNIPWSSQHNFNNKDNV